MDASPPRTRPILVAALLLAAAGFLVWRETVARGEGKALLARHLEEGRRAAESLGRTGDRLHDAEERRRRLAESAPRDPEEEGRKALWQADAEIEELRRRRADERAALLGAFTRALGVDPGCEEAQRALAGYHWTRYLEAEAAGRIEAMAESRGYVLAFDRDGTWRKRFDVGGTVLIDSLPAGAEVYVFRYEPGGDGRLLPQACSPVTAQTLPAPAGPAAEGAYPFACSDFNRVGPPSELKLPRGSYLFLLRSRGYADARYPVFVNRDVRITARVKLYAAEEIGEGFVFLPAGPFIAGGDPEADGSAPMNPAAFAGDVFIARQETTMGDYADFLLHLAEARNLPSARKRVPRTAAGAALWTIDRGSLPRILPDSIDPAIPVTGISWEDAEAYCEWRSERDGRKVRLPTGLEWEKAARGADGRRFPWGDRFDPSFAAGGPEPGPAGAVAADESPYGIRDLGGSVREWCQDWSDERQMFKNSRGGGPGALQAVTFRSASRRSMAPGDVDPGTGFRIAMEPRRAR